MAQGARELQLLTCGCSDGHRLGLRLEVMLATDLSPTGTRPALGLLHVAVVHAVAEGRLEDLCMVQTRDLPQLPPAHGSHVASGGLQGVSRELN